MLCLLFKLSFHPHLLKAKQSQYSKIPSFIRRKSGSFFFLFLFTKTNTIPHQYIFQLFSAIQILPIQTRGLLQGNPNPWEPTVVIAPLLHPQHARNPRVSVCGKKTRISTGFEGKIIFDVDWS